jgi:hypothetical protein
MQATFDPASRTVPYCRILKQARLSDNRLLRITNKGNNRGKRIRNKIRKSASRASLGDGIRIGRHA